MDSEWLADAGRRGWVVLTKDDRIRYREAEINAVSAHKVRVFCLTTGKLMGAEQAQRFTGNINRIVQRARKSGPYIYGVYEDRLRLLWPRK